MTKPPSESRKWFCSLRRAFGEPPSNYLVFDIETTGLSKTQDLITQVGYCRVEDGSVTSRGSVMLNWLLDSRVDGGWFEGRLRNCEAEMKSRGSACQVTFERVAKEGHKPREVLEGIAAMLEEARGCGLVGHNVLGFDIPILARHFDTYAAINSKPAYEFPSVGIWDTGVLEKARQLEVQVRPGIKLTEFFNSVRNMFARGVYWSLERECVPAYGLVDKAEAKLLAHDAGYDCWLTHRLFEAQRALMQPELVPAT